MSHLYKLQIGLETINKTKYFVAYNMWHLVVYVIYGDSHTMFDICCYKVYMRW